MMYLDWAILCVQPGREIELSRRLHMDGFDVYCPRVSQKLGNRYSKNKYDRYRIVRHALFPGYFFARIDRHFKLSRVPSRVEEDISMIRDREGRLLTISEDQVNSIRRTESEANTVPGAPAEWKENEVVRILGEAFEGTKGKITELRAKSARVSFTHEGRSTELYVRLSSLRKA